ncbi:hypothetical protein N431DRAFT_480625 [Stipitochalara longipes BDJ]|nr:hypothetical protein N431DRAFT_480625 [Stipitochalara longipes BDJ]
MQRHALLGRYRRPVILEPESFVTINQSKRNTAASSTRKALITFHNNSCDGHISTTCQQALSAAALSGAQELTGMFYLYHYANNADSVTPDNIFTPNDPFSLGVASDPKGSYAQYDELVSDVLTVMMIAFSKNDTSFADTRFSYVSMSTFGWE